MRYEGKYAIFNYDEKDKDLIYHLESYINDKATRIFDFFGYVPSEKVNISIIPTKEEYDNQLKKIRNSDLPIPLWNIGTTTYDNRINLVSLNDYQNTAFKNQLNNYDNALLEYQKTILHEFVHYVTISYCNEFKYPIPCKCLLEGIAQYLSGQREDKKMEFKYSLDDLLLTNNCYDGWLLFVRYILTTFPEDYFIGLLEDYNYASREIISKYEDVKKYYKG